MKRVPITIPHNRRNEYNPEFLNVEVLLRKYTPLMKSLHRYFCSYSGILDQPSDVEDLYTQIELEFIRLTKRFDPRRGVDFSGYIKFNLRHRIFYFVTKLQNQQKTELLLLPSLENDNTEEFNYLPAYTEQVDEASEQAMFRLNAIHSIPWNKITNPSDRELIEEVLNHKSLEEIAKSRHTTTQAVNKQFESLCDFLIQCSKEEQ